MRTRISALLGMVVGLASLAAAGQPAAYAARRVKAPPVIDGKLDDACWTAAAAISPERDKEAADARDKTVVRLCYDDKALYLGADLFHPDPAKLAPRCKERDDEVCVDDSLELFLYPNPEPEAQMVYHWIFNSIPVYYDGQELFTDAGISFSSAWNGYIVAKTSVQKDRWSLEVEIPFGSLGLRPGTRSTWGLGLLANRLGFRDRYQWWPPRSGFTTKGPSALGRLELPGLDFEPFYVSLGDLSLRGCLREAERASLVLSGTALWEASADKAPMEGGLLAQVTTPSGKLLEQKQGFVLKPLATAPFRLLVPATEKGKYGVRCRLADAAGRPLCIREETIETTAEPLRLTLLRPSYRNAIFSKMADKTLRAEAEIDADPGLLADYSLEAKLLPSGREEPLLLRQTFQTLQSNRVLIEKDMKELPDGRYELRATLWRKKGKERVAAASEAIRKLPPSEVEVWFEGRTLHINGRPTFLRVLEGVNPCEYFVRINLEAGFNCFVNWHEPFHKGGQFLPMMAKHDAWLLPGARPWYQKESGAKLPDALTDDEKKGLEQWRKSFFGHPRMIGYEVGDEPDIDPRVSLPSLRRGRELMAELDPYRLIELPLSSPGNWASDRYKGLADLCGGSDYISPRYGELARDAITSMLNEVSRAIHDGGWRPYMSSLQLFDSRCWEGRGKAGFPGRLPCFVEQRYMAWRLVQTGVVGIEWWAHSHDYAHPQMNPAGQEAVRAVVGELAYLEPVITQGKADAKVKMTSDTPGIGLWWRELEGDLFIVATNDSPKPIEARITVKSPKAIEQLNVLSEGRSLPLKAGAFQDSFPLLGVHIYTTRSRLPDLPIARALKEELFTAVPVRLRKEGNLAAEAGGARASGNPTAYISFPDLAAFAIDGDPRTCWFDGNFQAGWNPPKEADSPAKAPYLTIAFPREEEISRVVVRSWKPVCFPNDRCYIPKDYSVQVPEGAGWRTVGQVKGNADVASEARFPTVKTKQFRILFGEINILVAEVEAYR